MKKLRTLLLICILLIFVGSTSFNSEAASTWKKIDGQWYYVLDNGTYYKNGWLKYEGKYYYCDTKDGHMLVGWQQLPISSSDPSKKAWYYLDTTDGYMLTGWQVLPVNNVATTKATYYLDEGQMTIGWKQISNKWYYFDTNGRMLKGWQELTSSGTSSKNWYYLDTTDGHVLTNWQYLPISNDSTTKDWYYFASSGIMQKGWKNLDGKVYYLKSNGRMTTGLADLTCDADGKEYTYYFNSDGIRQSGWFYLNNEWKYFNADGQLFHILINATNFPDTAIRKFVKTLDKNNNNYYDYDELPNWIDYAKPSDGYDSNNNNFSGISESIADVSCLEYLLPKIYMFNFIESETANSKITNLNLSKASNVKSIRIENLNNLTSITTNSVKLQYLYIYNNKKLTTITNSASTNDTDLSVNIYNCDSITSYNNIYNSKSLTINKCKSISNINITKCTNLFDISLYDLPKITSIDFSKNTKLNKVSIDFNLTVNNYNITEYTINSLSNITLPDFTKYTKLQDLYIRAKFDDIPIIKLPKTSGKLKVNAFNYDFNDYSSFLVDNRNNTSADLGSNGVTIVNKEGFYKIHDRNSSSLNDNYTCCYVKFDQNDYPYIVKGDLDTDLGHFSFDINGYMCKGQIQKGDGLYLYTENGILPSEAMTNGTKIIGTAVSGLIDSDTFKDCFYFDFYWKANSRSIYYYNTTLYSYCDKNGKVLTGRQTIDGKDYDFEKIILYTDNTNDYDIDHSYIYAVAPNSFMFKIDSDTYSINANDIDNASKIKYYNGTTFFKEGVLNNITANYRISNFAIDYKSTAFLFKDYELVTKHGINKYNNSLYYVKNYNSMIPNLGYGLIKDTDDIYYYANDPENDNPYKVVQNDIIGITTKYSDTNFIIRYYLANEYGQIKPGFAKFNGLMFYSKPQTSIAPFLMMNEKFTVENKDYYATEDGSLYSGWYYDDKNSYYYKDDYSLAKNEILIQNNKKMYVLPDGKLITNGLYNCLAEGDYYNKLICVDELGFFVDGISKNHYYCIDGIVQRNIEINGEIPETYVLHYKDKVHIVKNSSGNLIEEGTYSYKVREENNNYTDYDTYILVNYDAITGIYSDGKNTYYFNEDCIMQKDKFINIEGPTKYFDIYGQMKTGYFNGHNNQYYFAEPDGSLMSGFIIDDTYPRGLVFRIARDDYSIIEGPEFVEFLGDLYYIKNYQVERGLFAIQEDGKSVYRYGSTSENGKLKSGWQTINNNTYYFGTREENNYAAKEGLTKIDNKYYYLTPSTFTGWKDIKIKDKTVNIYFGPDAKTGLFTVKNDTYYMDPTTYELAKNTLITIDDKHYVFDSNGHQITTPGFTNITTTYYYIDSNGYAITGPVKENNYIYYFNDDCTMCTTSAVIDGQTVEFYSSGKIKNGNIVVDGVEYNVTDGIIKIKDGWTKEDNHNVYYKDNKKVTGLKVIDNKTYYFDSNGYMQTGWITISNKKYYFNADGTMKTGWLTLSNKKYYFNTDGSMVTGWTTINKNKYYFNTDGTMTTGWKQLSNKLYYFNASGVMLTKWLSTGGNKYYFNDNGVMVTGEVTIDGKKYKFDSNGKLISEVQPIKTSGWVKTSKGWKYQFSTSLYAKSEYVNGYWLNAQGFWTYKYKASWKHNKTGWWYGDSTGWYAKNQWLKIDQKWYYFNKAGYIVTGWKKISNKWYYFNKSGAMQTGWLKLSNKWYYLDPTNGYMLTNTSKKIGNKTYKFDKNGVCINP